MGQCDESWKVLLPPNWPRRVKSALVHVIALAPYAAAYTRSWAANSRIARLRLKAENDRLQQEVALLTEEIRIKDARLRRVDPQKRPHYAPTERMAILELRAARAIGSVPTRAPETSARRSASRPRGSARGPASGGPRDLGRAPTATNLLRTLAIEATTPGRLSPSVAS